MISFFTLFLITILLIILIIWKNYKFYILSFKLPGPKGLPIIGIGYKMLPRENILPYLTEMKEKYGSIYVSSAFLNPLLITTNPDVIEKILTLDSFTNKSMFYSALKFGMGDGLIVANGPKWYKHRKLLKSSFSHKVIVSFFPIFNDGIKTFMEKLDELTNQNAEIDLLKLLLNCTIDISCQTTMGEKGDFQNHEDTNVANTLVLALYLMVDRVFSPWLHSEFMFKLSSLYKPSQEVFTILRNFRDKLVNKRLQEFDLKKINKNINNDDIIKPSNIFIDQALLLLNDKKFDLAEVQDESMTVIFTAVETSAVTVNTVLILLAMHPEYQEKLFQNILIEFPEQSFDVNYENLKNLPYLDQILNESFRILPTVPIIGRQSSNDVDIGNNIIIPKGTEVGIDIFNLHRDENIWGKNSKIFYPEHFLPDNFRKVHPYAFIPFSKGMRNCIGWEYGLLATKLMLIHLVRNYEFSTDFKFNDLVCVESITIKFKEYPSMKIKKRLI